MLWNILFFCEKLLHLVEYVNINNNKSSLQWSWLLNNEHTNAMKNVVCSSDHDLFYGLFRSGKRDTWPLKSLGSTPNDYTEVKLNIFIVSYYWISWIIENYFWIPTAQRSCKYSCFLHALDIFFFLTGTKYFTTPMAVWYNYYKKLLIKCSMVYLLFYLHL